MDGDQRNAAAANEDGQQQHELVTDGNAAVPTSDVYRLTFPKSLEEELAEEYQRIHNEPKTSQTQVMDPQNEEKGEVVNRDVTTTTVQAQKNWGEFGYDLDFAETPDEMVLTNHELVDSAPGPVSSEAKGDCNKDEVTLEIAQDLNQMLASKGSSGASTTTTLTTITSSRVESTAIPSGEAVEKVDKGNGDAPADESQLQNTFDAFLSDDDDDTLIANIWDGTNRETTEKKQLQYPTQQGNRVPSSSGDSSEHDFVEHGSTLFGLRTRNVIWTAAVIFCSAVLVVCLSLIVAGVTTGNDGSEANPSPPASETIDPGDFVAPTVPRSPVPPSEGAETTPVAPVSTEGTSIAQGPEPTLTTSTTMSTACGDIDGVSFFINGIRRNCSWLRGNTTDDYQRSICEWNEPVRSNCRDTCRTCGDGLPPAPASSPVATPTTVVPSPTLSPISAAPTGSCPPDLLGSIPGETVTCLWLSRVNEHYRTLQCTEELTREHCPATCRVNCGASA